MKRQAPKKPARRSRLITWIMVAAVVGLIGYGLSQLSNVAYTAQDIRVVDFSSLDAKQRRSALEAVNQARCNCGCGMTLAQCVATDSTCPVREGNIDRIKAMVRQAARPMS